MVIISHEDFPGYTGLSNRVQGLLKCLRKRKRHLVVVSPRFYAPDVSDFNESISNEQIDVVAIRKILGRVSMNLARIFAKTVFALLASIICILRHRDSETVQFEHVAGFLPAFALRIMNPKVRIIADDMNLLHIRRKGVLRTIIHAFECFIFSRCTVVTTASSKTMRFLKKRFPDLDVRYLSNGISPSEVPKDRLKEKRIDAVFVGFMGFNQNREAVRKILRMVRKYEADSFQANIVIVGGPDEYIEEFNKSRTGQTRNLRFLGPVSDANLESVLNESRVGLLPFFKDTPRWGGQMTKALTYFSRGLLVISGPEGIEEISGLKESEHYLRVNDLQEMHNVIKEVIGNWDAYQDIARRGQEEVSRRFSWSAICKSYCEIVDCLG